jgi:Putative phage abortive infection protein
MNLEPPHSEMKSTIWIVLVAIVVSWVIYWAFVTPFVSENKFDPLNTLFSGLAFWGVIYAILLQRNELALQRKELELTRQELRGQKEQLESQNITLKQQRFENTFFSLLNLFNNIVDSIEIRGAPRIGDPPSVLLKGRECFSTFSTDFSQHYSKQQRANPNMGHRVLCVTAYELFAGNRQALVGHYFRTLYNIVKFIGSSKVENQQVYINILRAQLSSAELTLLFYNCISKYGSDKFKPLVEKFGLLENMDFSGLIDPKHRELFNDSAFHSPS